MADTLRQKMEALASDTRLSPEYRRGVVGGIALLDQICADKEMVEMVARVLYGGHSAYNSEWDSEPEERKAAWRHQAQDAIRAFVGEK